jgi:hypothetical protein
VSGELTPARADKLAGRMVAVLEGTHGSLNDRKIPSEIAKTRPPARRPDVYHGRIDRRTPGCVVLLVDCSNSMHHRLAGSGQQRHAFVAQSINDTVYELASLAEGTEGMRHYFDVGVLGYGLGEDGTQVRSLLPLESDGLASIVDIYAVHEDVEEMVRVQGPDKTWSEQRRRREVWVKPTANRRGRTVARRAFSRAQDLVESWVEAHPDSFPPIVINITDGGYDAGEDPAQVVRGIQELATRAGNALVFNCHLADAKAHRTKAGTALFPDEDEASDYTGAMRVLFDESSPLPPSMLQKARELGYDVQDGARGYVYNADATTLVDFLNVGTIPGIDRG